MDLKISKNIKDTTIKNYANNNNSNNMIKIDCSDGQNPYGCSHRVIEELNKINLNDLTQYSHDNKLKKELAKYWNIQKDNIILCNGSIDGLSLINQLFLSPNAKLLSFVPCFPDFCNHAKLLGYKHKKLFLNKCDNYKYNIDYMIVNIDSSINLIYIDNPNNPTGQVLEKSDAIKLLNCAKKYGIGVIIDEAYADYISKEKSCINLISEYDNLIIVRTFSKGFGLAGLRLGYIISNKTICNELSKISSIYNGSQIARKLAMQALNDNNFLDNCIKQISINKARLIEALPQHINIATYYRSCSYLPIIY